MNFYNSIATDFKNTSFVKEVSLAMPKLLHNFLLKTDRIQK